MSKKLCIGIIGIQQIVTLGADPLVSVISIAVICVIGMSIQGYLDRSK